MWVAVGCTGVMNNRQRSQTSAFRSGQREFQVPAHYKTPEPPIRWNVYKIASKAVWLDEIEAPDEAAAMEKAAAEFKVPDNRLMAIRR
jgi:hypothetical protein